MDYLDFELEIGAGSASAYPITVIRSPAGEAHATLHLPFDDQGLENQLSILQQALGSSAETGPQGLVSAEQTIQRFGQALLEALFTGQVRDLYVASWTEAESQGKGLRVKLRLQPPELAALPWEFLYDANQKQYLCLSNKTPVVRYVELPAPCQALSVTPPLSILGMTASPKDVAELDVAREQQRIDAALAGLQAKDLAKVSWLAGHTWEDLQQALLDGPWHIFHFIGHGGFDPNLNEGVIVLEDTAGQARSLSATQMGLLLADHAPLRLVVLNACEGARGSTRTLFVSTAATLVRRGIPAVLAMQYAISDGAALAFARVFYTTLAAGLPVDTAVGEARKAIRLGGAQSLEWGTPVLHMHTPDGVLFELPPSVAPPSRTRETDRTPAGSTPGRTPVTTGAHEPPLSVFISYAHEDEPLRQQLEAHLSLLRRQGLVASWHDHQILAGEEWAADIDQHLETASIILLLISSDFLASNYCYDIEMKRALERHQRGEARVIPIILRPCDWRTSPFAHLQCLPRDGKAVTTWQNPDEAFLTIAEGLRRVIERQQIPARPLSRVEQQNRTRLLKRMRATWIEGVLERSLHQAALIALDLQEQPDVLANPWQLEVQETNLPPRSLPPGTSIAQVYDEAEGELLILGEPGAGKTTLLLQLARDLLKRAEQEGASPMPVIFNLSSWAEKRLPFTDWLVEELLTKYQVPRNLGRSWVKDDQLLLLLDGLDEVNQLHRSACIQAINAYRQEHNLVPVILCSRKAEYEAQSMRVTLSKAVVIQPLTSQQIDDYLRQAGQQLEAVRSLLHQDQELQELARTPLMLTILALAYRGKAVNDLVMHLPPDAQRRHVFGTYVERMLQRRAASHYPPEQTKRWLGWLAKQMVLHSQATFFIEHMQPDWLGNERSHQHYPGVTVGLIFGLVGALCLGPIGGLIFAPSPWSGIYLSFVLLCGLVSGVLFGLLNGSIYGKETERIQIERRRGTYRRAWGRIMRGALNGWLVGLLVGLPYGLSLWRLQGSDKLTYVLATGVAIGLAGGLVFILIDGFLSIQTTEIRLVESFAWSWTRMGRNLVKFLGLALLGSLLIGLLFGLFSHLYEWAMNRTKNVLSDLPGTLQLGLQFTGTFGPYFALIGGLLGALTGGLSDTMPDTRTLSKPNQGIRRSARYSILVGVVGIVIGGVVGGLLGRIKTEVPDPELLLAYGLIIGPLIGVVSGLRMGGIACIQHAVLRWSLWRAGSIPWDYPHFLDYAAEHILLRKVGGGYIFIHQQLVEYFTSLNNEESSE